MLKLTAIEFKEDKFFFQGLVDLTNYEPNKTAIIASFYAEDLNGVKKDLDCFIEHDGKNFQITNVIDAKPNSVNISSLKIALRAKQNQIKPNHF